MSKRYNEKRRKQAEEAIEKELNAGYGAVDHDALLAADVRDAALGKGEEELFEKKLTKEEKKAKAKAAREAKKKAKGKAPKKDDEVKEEKKDDKDDIDPLDTKKLDEIKKDEAMEWLNQQNINVTFENRKTALHANARDINVSGVTVTFHGKPLIEDTDLVINYGNRYGFIGPNGSGKSTIMKAIAARAVPIPAALDIYFLDSEYPARDDITALEAVMESNDEIALLEKQAEALNNKMAEVDEDEQIEIQAQLESVYSRLDQLDAASAEARATTILYGLGFTKKMQGMTTREFSGGWRMRVALARALFLQPEFLLLDGTYILSIIFIIFSDISHTFHGKCLQHFLLCLPHFPGKSRTDGMYTRSIIFIIFFYFSHKIHGNFRITWIWMLYCGSRITFQTGPKFCSSFVTVKNL